MERLRNAKRTDEWLTNVSVGRRMRTWVSAAALVIASAGLAACGGEDSAGPESGGADVAGREPIEADAGHLREVTLSELSETPNAYIAQVVTVSGRVADDDVDRDRASMAAFTLGEGVENPVLVLPMADVSAEGVSDGAVVRVEGKVHQVEDALAAGGELRFRQDGIDDEFLDNFQDQIAIVATGIDTEVRAGG